VPFAPRGALAVATLLTGRLIVDELAGPRQRAGNAYASDAALPLPLTIDAPSDQMAARRLVDPGAAAILVVVNRGRFGRVIREDVVDGFAGDGVRVAVAGTRDAGGAAHTDSCASSLASGQHPRRQTREDEQQGR
jgi:hypothetical protein